MAEKKKEQKMEKQQIGTKVNVNKFEAIDVVIGTVLNEHDDMSFVKKQEIHD